MEQQQWRQAVVRFQARCRGYLTRKELRSVKAEYEDVVRELEGSLEHLAWRGMFIPKPHFTDRVGALFPYPISPKIQPQGHLEAPEKTKDISTPISEILVAERDEEPKGSLQKDCRVISAAPECDGEEMLREGWIETAGSWETNSLQQKGPQTHALLKDVAPTPEALRQHRRTLGMELVWIQQAIASRKKYLTLKQKMEKA